LQTHAHARLFGTGKKITEEIKQKNDNEITDVSSIIILNYNYYYYCVCMLEIKKQIVGMRMRHGYMIWVNLKKKSNWIEKEKKVKIYSYYTKKKKEK